MRLGEGEFEEEEILPEAIERLVIVCKQLTELARTFHTDEFVAVATSAMREAANQQEILHRLATGSPLDVRVISGQEEARLIYLGCLPGNSSRESYWHFLSISVAEAQRSPLAENRTTSISKVSGWGQYGFQIFTCPMLIQPDAVSPAPVQESPAADIRDAIIQSVRKIQDQKPDLAIGSSGTIMNLL